MILPTLSSRSGRRWSSRTGAIAIGLLLSVSTIGVRAQTYESGPKTYPSGATRVPATGYPTTLITSNTVTVPAGANVTYVATQQLQLKPGFSVAPAGTFRTVLDSANAPKGLAVQQNGVPFLWLQWQQAAVDTGTSLYEISGTGMSSATGAVVSVSALTGGTTGMVRVLPGVTYVLRIRVRDNNNTWSDWSAPLTITTPGDGAPPSVPANIKASAVTNNSFNLTWDEATDAMSWVAVYEIRVDGVSLGTVQSLSRLFTGLLANTRYVVEVRACDWSGNWSSWSQPLAVVTAAGNLTLIGQSSYSNPDGSFGTDRQYQNQTSVPMVVSGIYEETYSDPAFGADSQSGFEWTIQPNASVWESDHTDVYQASGYSVRRRNLITGIASVGVPQVTCPPTILSAVGLPLSIAMTANNNPTTYTATGLPDGLAINAAGVVTGTPTVPATYTVTVRATNSYGTGQGTVVWTTINDTTPPVTPGAPYFSALTAPGLGLNWPVTTDNIGVTGYQLWRNGTLYYATDGNALNLTFDQAGIDYSFVVRARDGAGNWSSNSSALTVHTYQITMDGGTVNHAVAIPGSRHQVTAATPPVGKYFTGWTVTGPGSVDYPAIPSATFTAGAGNATLHATYADGFQLRGAGNGVTFSASGGDVGRVIDIHAPAPDAGYNFVGWNLMGPGMIDNVHSQDAHMILGPGDATIWPSYRPNSLAQPVWSSVGAPDYGDVNTPFPVLSYAELVGDTFDFQSLDYSVDGGLTWVMGDTARGTKWTGTSTWQNYTSWSFNKLLPSITVDHACTVLFRSWAAKTGPNVAPNFIIPAFDKTQVGVSGALPWTPTNLRAENLTATSVTLRWDAASGCPSTVAYEVYISGGGLNGVLGSNGQNLFSNVGNLVPGTSYTFKVRARVWSDTSAWSAPLTIAAAAPPVITSATTASCTVGTWFNYQITASNSPTSFAAAGLPPGLSVSSAGLISGTPSIAGTSTATISATNDGGTGTAALTITVAAASSSPPVISSSSAAPGAVGAAFSYQITASGSPTSYNASGLPTGLAVSTSTGTITGTPTVVGTFSVTLSATNAAGTGTSTLTLTVTASPDGTIGSNAVVAPETDGTYAALPAAWPNATTTRTEVVAFTPADFSVNASGEATTRIPIAVTPGVAGLQPGLALSYNHNGGNGYLGVGWSLQGLSVIARRPGTLATDGAISPVNMDANDRFALDGQKLVKVATDSSSGTSVTEYRTEIDGYSRIFAYPPASGPNYGPERFVVKTKGGLTMEYGATFADMSRSGRIIVPANVQAPAGAVVAWALDTVTDRNGNKMRYYYTKDTASGEFYVSSIAYLGSENAKIEFIYQDRTDVASGYFGGCPWARTKRLWKIEVKHDTSLMRRYELTYDSSPNTGRLRIRKVQESDAEGNSIPAVQFDYKQETSGWSDQNQTAFQTEHPLSLIRLEWGYPIAGQTGSGLMDIDGDGIPDFLARHDGAASSSGYVAKGSAAGWLTGSNVPTGFVPPWPLGASTDLPINLGVRFVDLDSDGYPDMIKSSDDPGANSGVYLNSSTGWSSTSSWNPTAFLIGSRSGDPDRGTRFVDLDGDGRTDVIWSRFVSGTGQIGGALRNNGQTWESFASDPGRPGHGVYDPPEGIYISPSEGAGHGSDSGVRIIDINGDGLPDLLRSWPGVDTQAVAYLNTGAGWRLDSAYAPRAPISRAWGAAAGSEFVDVNADGLPDQVVNEQVSASGGVTNTAVTYLNTGKGWVLADARFNLPLPLLVTSDRMSIRYGVVLQDVNGDGLTDFGISTFYKNCASAWVYPLYPATGSEGGSSRIYLNTGNGWSQASYRPTPFIASVNTDRQGFDMGTQVIDLNGDGMVDLVQHYAVQGGTAAPLKQAYLNASRHPDLLETITYSSGLKTQVIYSTLAQNENSFYTRGGRVSASPLIDIQDARYVVRQVTEADGVGGNYHLDYRYTALRQHLSEGNVGFEKIRVTDDRTQKATSTYYRQDYPYIGTPWKLETALASGRVINRSTTTWAAQANGGATRVKSPYAQQVIVEAFDPDSSATTPYLTTTTTVNGITAWGDISDQKSSSSDGYGSRTTRTISYSTATSAYPGQISSERDTETGTTAAPLVVSNKTRTADITYDAVGRPSVVSQEPLTKQDPTDQDWIDYKKTDFAKAYYLTTTYHYDPFGNTDTITVDGPGLPASRKTSLYYDPAYEGRFLTKKTNAEGHVESYSDFDEAKAVAKTCTDQNSLVTKYVFDGLGRATQVTAPGNVVTKIARRWAAATAGPALSSYHVETITDGQPPTLVFFDALSRPLRSISISPDDRLVFVDTFRDTRGNVTATTRPYFAAADRYATYTEYDAIGRLQTVAHEAKLTVNANGQITAATTAIGQSTFTYADFTITETRPSVAYIAASGISYTRTGTVKTTRNSLGKVTEVVESGVTTETNKPNQTLSATISYAYDGHGELEVMVDPINATTTYTVDAYGRRTKAEDPNRGTWTFGYNPLGELVSQTDQNAKKSTFAYDRIARMTSRTIDTLTTVWVYDTAAGKGIGKLATVTSFGGVSESFEYDEYGRTKKQTRSLGSGAAQVNYVRQFGYDGYHRLKTVTHDDSGFKERRGYSGYGHWVALRNGATDGRYWLGSAFEADGRVKTIVYGNGITTDRTYDNARGGVLDSVVTGTQTAPGSVQNQQYFYEPGRVGSLYKRLDFAHGVAEGFTYDALTRLSSTYLGAASAGSTAIAVSQRSDYTYDLAGNITSKNAYSASNNQLIASASVGTYNYFASAEQGVGHGAHAIKSIGAGGPYSYDGNGNVKTADDLTIGWTPFNQPETITRGTAFTSFSYGPDLQRVRQVHGAETVDYASESHEYRVAGGVGQHVHYLVGPFGRMGEIMVSGGTVTEARYFHHDHLGSVDTITGLDGSSQAQSYDPWGQRRSGATWQDGLVSSVERRGFTDHEHLDEVKLINMNGRVYDPKLGRFLSVDPLYDRLYETQGLNGYSYVRNNPVSYIDPDGLMTAAQKAARTELARRQGMMDPQFVEATRFKTQNTTSCINGQSHTSQIIPFDAYVNNSFKKYAMINDAAGQRVVGDLGAWNRDMQYQNRTVGELSDFEIEWFLSSGVQSKYSIASLAQQQAMRRRLRGFEKASNAASTAIEISMGLFVLPEEGLMLGRLEAAESRLAGLQTKFEALADEHLLPRYRALDPNLEAGYTGSFRTGTVGNPTKATFGQPIDLTKFDIDYWIKSDALFEKFGPNLRADVQFRQILSETPGFEGLKPNKAGFSIKFRPSSE